MSIQDALIELVGAGVLSLSSVAGQALPADALAGGVSFLGFLEQRRESQRVAAILDEIGRDAWVDDATRGINFDSSTRHARGLTGLIAIAKPQIDEILNGLANDASAKAAQPPARRLATEIVRLGREKGVLSKAGLKDDVALLMLERLYARLLHDPSVIMAMKPAFAAFVTDQIWRTNVKPNGGIRPSNPAGAGKPDPLAGVALTPELREQLRTRGEMQALLRVKERTKLSDKGLQRLIETATAEKVPAGRLISRLEEMATAVADLVAQLARQSNEPADLRKLKTLAAQLLADGEFERARDQLADVRRLARDDRRRSQERLEDEIASLKIQMNDEAVATSRLADLALAGLDYDGAVKHLTDAADCLPHGDREGAFSLRMRRADALYRKGEDRADTEALVASEAEYKALISQVAADAPVAVWGALHAGYGHVLQRLGEREGAPERYKAAAAAYRLAVKKATKESDPSLFVASQIGLGKALAIVGERENGAQWLKDASLAFEAALDGLDAEKAPAEYTQAQMGLGNALLGIRERGGGDELLERADKAYLAAFGGLSRERSAIEWATTKLNHGSVLLGIGETTGKTESLAAAQRAFREALLVFSKDTAPVQWALAKMNLANALAAMGERETGNTAKLEEAIVCYDESLAVYDKLTVPMQWAICKMNLGTVLVRLGEAKDQRKNWLAAAAAMVPALETFETLGAEDYAEITRRNLRSLPRFWESLSESAAPAGKRAV